VVHAQSYLVTVYVGTSRNSVVCAPVCQPSLMLGDDSAFTNDAYQSAQVIKQSASQ
jgi:hypothetical protein